MGKAFLAMAVAAFAVALPVAASADPVGRTSVVVQDVKGTLGGAVRHLALRDPVNQNELIETGLSSASEIVFLDGSQIALGPTSQIIVDEMVYDPRASQARLGVDVATGAFRFVSGGFASPAYRIKTPTATIALRGTRVFCYIPAAVSGTAQPTTCNVISGQITMVDRATGASVTVHEGETATVGGSGLGSGSSAPGGGVPEIQKQFADLNALLSTQTAAAFAGRPMPVTAPVVTLSSYSAETSSGLGLTLAPGGTIVEQGTGGPSSASPTLP